MGSLLRAMIGAVAAASVLKSAAAAPPTVVMYETRRLDGDTYWRASYELAAAYASRHGHNFVLYTLPDGLARLDACDGSRLGPYWGKAAAAVQAVRQPSISLVSTKAMPSLSATRAER